MRKVLRCDCFTKLKSIKSNSVDLICIDPPYGINYNKEEWDKQPNWDFLFKQFKRILKDTGNLLIFQGWSNVSLTLKEGLNYFSLQNWIIYDRIKGRGAKTNFTSTREDLLWFTKSKNYTFNKIYSNIPKKTKGLGLKNNQPNRSLSNIWTDISPIVPWSKERVDHPTQKPLQLMERIITIFSNEKDLVLDCFAGSGTTLVAAKRLNRQFLGMEKEKKYFKVSVARIKLT